MSKRTHPMPPKAGFLLRSIARHLSKALFVLGALLPAVAAADIAWIPSASGSSVTLAGLEPARAVRTFAIEPAMWQKVESALLTPDNATLLLIDKRLNRIIGIDVRAERKQWTVEVPEGPEAARLSADGRQLVVCAERAGKVVFVDITERRVVGSISIDAPPPEDCAFSPDGHWMVVSHHGRSSVTAIDMNSGRQQARITTVGQPAAMLFVGDEVWLAIPDKQRLQVLDSRTWSVTATLASGLHPSALAASPDGRRIYVANRAGGTVSEIDTASRRVIRHVPAGRAPAQLALSRDGRRLLVSDRQHTSALLLDTFRMRPAGEIHLPHTPWGAVLQH